MSIGGELGTADVYDSPYFGRIGSGTIGRRMDREYEQSLSSGIPYPSTSEPRLNPGGLPMPAPEIGSEIGSGTISIPEYWLRPGGMPMPGGRGGGQIGMPMQQSMQVPFYAPQGPAPVGQFDNTGRVADSTLLAQQNILNRPQNSYQPLVTPDTYQNFYGNQPTYSNNRGILAPDYRPMAQTFANDELIRRVARETGGSDSGQPYYGVDTSVGGSSGVTQDMLDAANATTDPMGSLISQIDEAAANTPAGAPVVSGPTNENVSSVSDSMINNANATTDPIGSLIDSINSNDGNAYGGAGDGGYGSGEVGYDAGDMGHGDGGGGGGGGKIICTAMNHAYGFGSFRNAIWIAYADKHLTKAHEVGYHTLFLPLVDFGFKRGDAKLNMAVRKVLEWGTRHRSTDLRAELRHTKRDTTGRIIRFIFEPLCYAVGKLKGY